MWPHWDGRIIIYVGIKWNAKHRSSAPSTSFELHEVYAERHSFLLSVMQNSRRHLAKHFENKSPIYQLLSPLFGISRTFHEYFFFTWLAYPCQQLVSTRIVCHCDGNRRQRKYGRIGLCRICWLTNTPGMLSSRDQYVLKTTFWSRSRDRWLGGETSTSTPTVVGLGLGHDLDLGLVKFWSLSHVSWSRGLSLVDHHHWLLNHKRVN